jgi:hypothetical protein
MHNPPHNGPVWHSQSQPQSQSQSRGSLDITELEPPPRITDPAGSSSRSSIVSEAVTADSRDSRNSSTSSNIWWRNSSGLRPGADSRATNHASDASLLHVPGGIRNISIDLNATSKTGLLEGNESKETWDYKSDLWTTKALHPLILVALALIFAFLIFGLEIMYRTSVKNHGLGPGTTTQQCLIHIIPPACRSKWANVLSSYLT